MEGIYLPLGFKWISQEKVICEAWEVNKYRQMFGQINILSEKKI
jgi:hypothetical protein